MTPEHGDDPAIEPEVVRRADDVGRLAARDDGSNDRPMDRAGDEPFDRDRLVDRRVEGDADDAPDRSRFDGPGHDPPHPSDGRLRLGPGRLGVRAARPHAWTAIRTRPRAAAPPRATGRRSSAARNPASNESPAPVASTASVASAATFTVAPSSPIPSAPSAPHLTATVRGPPPNDDASAPRRGLTSVEPGQPSGLHGVGQQHVCLRRGDREPAVPRPRRIPVGVEAGRRSGGAGGPEQPGELRGQGGLEEVAAGVDVPGPREELRRDVGGTRVTRSSRWR